MYALYITAFLPSLWSLANAAPQQQNPPYQQPNGVPYVWNPFISEQNGGSVKWIGPDPSHISYDVVMTTTNGIAETTTAPVDLAVLPATTTAADGSYQVTELITDNLISELTNAAQQACGGSRRRTTFAACVLDSAALKNTATELITTATTPEAAGALGALAVGSTVALALDLVANNKQIPHLVTIKINTPNKTLASSSPTSPAPGSNIPTSSSISITSLGSATTVAPEDKTMATSSIASTSTVSADSCWQYTGTDLSILGYDLDALVATDDNDPDNDPPDSKLRVRGDTGVALQERARGDANTLGSCPLPATIRTEPDYWLMKAVMRYLPKEQWWWVPTQVNRNFNNPQDCPVASMTQKGKADPNSASTFPNNFPAPYTNNADAGDGINVDHVYEVSFLKDFFDQELSAKNDQNDPRCGSFTEIFMKADGRLTDPDLFDKNKPPQLKAGIGNSPTANPAKFQDSRLQSLYNELPNKFNNAFIGMGAKVNGVKGCILNQECAHLQKLSDDVNKNLNLWNDIGMTFQSMTIPVFQAQFQKVHAQIYKGFISFEDIQACDTSLNLDTPWGQRYNDWLNNLLTTNQQLAADHVSKISVAVAKPEITGPPGNKNAFGKAVDQLDLSYGSDVIARGSLTFQRDKLVSIPPRTTLGIQRRDGGAVCPTTSTSTPAPTSTPAATTSAPTGTVCPDPKPNLAKNRCDEKCGGAGWSGCDASVKGQYDRYSCYCNAGPCGGQQCGDPVKIDSITGKGTKCPDQGDPALWFFDDQACDVICPNGNYGAGDSCFAKTTSYSTMHITPTIGPNSGTPTQTIATAVSTVSNKGGLVHWEEGSVPLCKCDDSPCRGYGCYDRMSAVYG